MPRLRPTLDRPLHRDGDPYDDGPLPDLTVRKGDCLARVGGDEFAVIAPGAEHTGAERLVEALAVEIDTTPMPDGIHAGVTFAWAVSPADGDTGDSVLSCADQRLLAHKREAKVAS